MNKTKRLFQYSMTLLIVMLIGAMAILHTHTSKASVSASSNDGNSVQIEASGFRLQRTIDEMINSSDSIVLVTVENIGAARWNTDDVENVESIQQNIQSGVTPIIYRPVTLRVEQNLYGMPLQPSVEEPLTLQQLGGTVGEMTMAAMQGIKFQEGEQFIVFLELNNSPEVWGFSEAYLIDGIKAYNVWDESSINTTELFAIIATAID